jgi:hypothetical protein
VTSIIQQIVTGVETLGKDAAAIWNTVKTDVENDVAAIKKVFPALAPEIDAVGSVVKQGASDALGIAATMLGDAQPAIISGTNAAADAALLALTGGAATPALPAFNGFIDGIEAQGVAALRSWALKQKAMLATAVGSATTPAAHSLDIPPLPPQ